MAAGLAILAFPVTAAATNSVLSGTFDGSESKIAALPGTCPGAPSLGYQAITNVRVGVSGNYVVADVFNFSGADLTVLLYNGNFNPNNPFNNLLTQGGIDIADVVSLNSGSNYTMVVQHWCQPREGAWAVTFSGPGSVNSGLVVTPPDFTEGSFAANDPTANTECGNSHYQEVGPINVARSGTYYYTDISINYAVDVCLGIYSAPFNPGSPNANKVAGFLQLDDFGSVELEAGRDYYFVTQVNNFSAVDTGEFFYVLAPPAPFSINHALAGGWYDPDTSGQGLVLDVFDKSNQMFAAWFTFDLQRPDSTVEAMIGDPGHRWMTAQGAFEGDSATLPVYWTSGMIFDSANPPPAVEQDGTLTLQFEDCTSGTVSYDLGAAGVSGQFPVVRLANDAQDLCESLYSGPGQPGPL